MKKLFKQLHKRFVVYSIRQPASSFVIVLLVLLGLVACGGLYSEKS